MSKKEKPVKFYGIPIGPPARDDGWWTQADRDSWETDENGFLTGNTTPQRCAGKGFLGGRCKKDAQSGNIYCASCQKK